MLELSEQKLSSNNERPSVKAIGIKRKKSSKNNDKNLNKNIINTISELLNNMCNDNSCPEINNKNIQSNKKIKLFMLKEIPQISIKDYLLRLSKHSKISVSTLVYILIYIDRFCHKYRFKINYYNIYKLIIASMVVAIKFNEDDYYSSEFYAKLGGISKIEMNSLEYEFATMINFNLYIHDELYYKYYNLLTEDNNQAKMA